MLVQVNVLQGLLLEAARLYQRALCLGKIAMNTTWHLQLCCCRTLVAALCCYLLGQSNGSQCPHKSVLHDYFLLGFMLTCCPQHSVHLIVLHRLTCTKSQDAQQLTLYC